MNLNKNIQANAFMVNNPFSTTFPDSFIGEGLKDIYLPDFVNQRITVIVSINNTEAVNINEKINGKMANGSLRYLNTLIIPEITMTETSEISFSITNESFVNNYNVDDVTDSGIIKSGDLDITINARTDAPELNYVINGVFSTIGTSGNMVLDITKPFSIIPIDNKEIYLNFRDPEVGDSLSALKFNNYNNIINLFSTDKENENFILKKTQFYNSIKLQASDAQSKDYFGRSVCNTDKYIVVGAPNEDTTETDAGSVYIYDIEKDLEIKIQASNAQKSDYFGYTVSISNNTLVVGAYGEDTTGSSAGSVYIYDLTNFDIDSIKASEIKIQSNDIRANDYFGYNVTISNDTLVVGAYGEDVAGAVYIYDLTNFDIDSIKASEIKIRSSDAQSGDYFGFNVSISNDTLVVGAYAEDAGTTDAGAVYIYDLTDFDIDSIQASEIKIHASVVQTRGYFGYNVSISNDTLVVGAHANSTNGTLAGSAYIYDLTNFDIDSIKASEIKIISSDINIRDQFGYNVAILNDTLVVSSPWQDTNGTDAGSVYMYDLTKFDSDSIMASEIKIQAIDGQGIDYFGFNVSISNDTLVVGAYVEDTGTVDAGSVYIYDINVLKNNSK